MTVSMDLRNTIFNKLIDEELTCFLEHLEYLGFVNYLRVLGMLGFL